MCYIYPGMMARTRALSTLMIPGKQSPLMATDEFIAGSPLVDEQVSDEFLITSPRQETKAPAWPEFFPKLI